VRRERTEAYRDQFEYLADCFDFIRKRGDAYTIRTEALESERMSQYGERSGFDLERSRLLSIYHGIETEVARKEEEIRRRRQETDTLGIRFPLDAFIERYRLRPEETQILLVLLHNESVGRSHARFSSGNEILNLLFPNPVSALKASSFLDVGATLLEEGLIRSFSDDEATNFLRAAYEVTEKTLHEVLGVRDRSTIRDQQHAPRTSSSPLESPFRIVAPRVRLDQVVLPASIRQGIEEVLWQADQGQELFHEWGLDEVVEKGRGTIVLFSGLPGTGKTMTAEAIAQRLGRPLYVADYAQLESKWIGETEKNIVAVFQAATQAGAVLLLDEADAVLGARLDGGPDNDRAYNRQVSILLGEMEAFPGTCILTTNRVVTLDEGLARRIAASFEFTIPEAEERARIWKALLPARVPLADDVDLDQLARRFQMAGGHIKNAVLTAVRKAGLRAGRGARVTQRDFIEAAAAEQDSFRPCSRPIGFREASSASYS
jgi:hypothetical protein